MRHSFAAVSWLILVVSSSVSAADTPANPTLSFSTIFGKQGGSRVRFMAHDRAGNIYIAGSTRSPIPLVNPLKSTLGTANCSPMPSRTFEACSDLFLAKFDPSGRTLLYSTYLGEAGPDAAGGLAVDAEGNAWVAGTAGPASVFADTPIVGGAYVVKVNPAGSAILYRQVLAGTNHINGLALDAQGNAFLAGVSLRDDFPALKALQPLPAVKSIFGTTDAGATWRPVNNGLPATRVFSMAIDPAQPATMYAATTRGLYKTINGGADWARILPAAVTARSVSIDASNSAIYVSYGDLPDEPVSLAKSSDGGSTWTLLSATLPRQPVFNQPQTIGAFAIDPKNPARIWVEGVGFFGQAVFKSEDGGRQWSVMHERDRGLSRAPESSAILLFDESRVAVCCLDAGGGGGSGLLVTVDGGKTWTEGAAGPSAGRLGLGSPVIDPLDRNTVYAPWYNGLLKSTDLGKTWTETPLPADSPTYGYEPGSLTIDPVTGAMYLVNNTGLLLRSADRGKTWTSSTGPWGPTARMLALDAVRPSSTFYVASWGPGARSDTHSHAFLAKLDADSGAPLWATLLGGSGVDAAAVIRIDSQGNPIIAGRTNSTDFPVVSTAAQRFKGAGIESDVFLAKLSAAGDRLLYSTYLGGSRDETVTDLALDANDKAYVTGWTNSPDLPVLNAIQPRRLALLQSGFVAKVDPAGGQLLYSTYLSGSLEDRAYGLTVDSEGGAWVVGTARSQDFPLVRPPQPGIGLAGVFLSRIAPGGGTLDFSTYLSIGLPAGARIDLARDALWLFGDTGLSDSLFIDGDASQTSQAYGFLARFDLGPPPVARPGVPLVRGMYNAASYRLGDVVSPGGIGTLFGSEFAAVTAQAEATPLPRELAGVTVKIGDIAAPLFFVSPGQINYQTPVELPIGSTELVVTRDGVAGPPRQVRVVEATPGIFTASGTGSGTPVVVHSADYRLVTEQNPARPGETLILFATGLGRTSPSAASGEPNPLTPSPLVDLTRLSPFLDTQSLVFTYAGLAPGLVGVYQVNFRLGVNERPGKKWMALQLGPFGAAQVPIYVR